MNSELADLITVKFANSEGQKTVFRINKKLRRYELDRSKSGAVDFDPRFAGEQFAPMPNAATAVSLTLFLDRSSLEIFINQGETVRTIIEFPSTPFDKVTLKADQPIELDSGAVYPLNSSWDLKLHGIPLTSSVCVRIDSWAHDSSLRPFPLPCP